MHESQDQRFVVGVLIALITPMSGLLLQCGVARFRRLAGGEELVDGFWDAGMIFAPAFPAVGCPGQIGEKRIFHNVRLYNLLSAVCRACEMATRLQGAD